MDSPDRTFFLSSPVVPHITDAIQEWVVKQAKVPVDDDDVEPQVCVIEVGLTLFLIITWFAFLHMFNIYLFQVYLSRHFKCLWLWRMFAVGRNCWRHREHAFHRGLQAVPV